MKPKITDNRKERLTKEDNLEQEPSIETIESKANSKRKSELAEAAHEATEKLMTEDEEIKWLFELIKWEQTWPEGTSHHYTDESFTYPISSSIPSSEVK
mgnify:CR=1 FL=1